MVLTSDAKDDLHRYVMDKAVEILGTRRPRVEKVERWGGSFEDVVSAVGNEVWVTQKTPPLVRWLQKKLLVDFPNAEFDIAKSIRK